MRKRNFYTVTLVAATAISLATATTVEGAAVISLQQEGDDVVGGVTGTLDMTGYSPVDGRLAQGSINPSEPRVAVGACGHVDIYVVNIAGPSSFGADINTVATSGNGSTLYFSPPDVIVVSYGYVSGDPLSGSATWANATLSSLGVTPGTYVWTWGEGDNADTFTLYAGVNPTPTGTVPTLSEWGMIALVLLLGAAAVSVNARQRRKSVVTA